MYRGKGISYINPFRANITISILTLVMLGPHKCRYNLVLNNATEIDIFRRRQIFTSDSDI